MSGASDALDILADFDGRAPLFPLPNVVHFPQVLLPLHIFEPRYRRMTVDALNGPRLIAMALLKPGWEADALSPAPPIHPVVCLGRITAEKRLPDGRYSLVLQGLARARVLDELPTDRPYRIGRMGLCREVLRDPPAIDRPFRRRQLLEGFIRLFPKADLRRLTGPGLDLTKSLGLLCDVLAAALELIPAEAQEILEELDVDRRSDLVLRHIRRHTAKQPPPASGRDFPPPFSLN